TQCAFIFRLIAMSISLCPVHCSFYCMHLAGNHININTGVSGCVGWWYVCVTLLPLLALMKSRSSLAAVFTGEKRRRRRGGEHASVPAGPGVCDLHSHTHTQKETYIHTHTHTHTHTHAHTQTQTHTK